MKVLVTGAAGFIGMHTSIRLLQEGATVVGVDNLNEYYDKNLKQERLRQLAGFENFSFEKIDISDSTTIARLFESQAIEYVVHLAAQAGVRYSLTNPHAYSESNLVGFLNILEACRQHNVFHLVYASSSSVYGGNTKMPFMESDPVDHPVSLYAATKKANELMAHTYSHLYNIPTTGLRFFTVYGPWGRPDMAYFSFTEKILRGSPITIYNHGKMKRDFTYIDDIVDGVVAVLKKPATPDPEFNSRNPNPGRSHAPYRIFNIGNQSPVTLGEFISSLESALKKEAKKVYMEMQPGDVESTFACIDELKIWTGCNPSTSLDEGLKRFAEWYGKWKK